MTKGNEQAPGAGTVALKRGLDAVRLLAEHGPLSAAELSERLSIRREAADRIVSTLQALGFIDETSYGERYLPALLVHRLASRYLDFIPIVSVAKPLLQGIADRHRVVISFVVRAENEALCLLKLGNRNHLQTRSRSRSAPLKQTYSGRAILSLVNDRRWWSSIEEKTQLERSGYLLEAGTAHSSCLAVPVWCGETPAAFEASFEANVASEMVRHLAEDMLAAASLLQQRLPGAGIRSIDL